MKYQLLAFLSILTILGLKAQEGQIPASNFRTLNLAESYFGLHLEPISYLLAADGRLRLGAVVQRPNISYLVDVEWGRGGFGGSFVNNDFEQSEGYRFKGIRPEVRIHWPRFWGTGYFGLEYAYNKNERLLENAGYFDPAFSPGADIFAFDRGFREIERHSLVVKYGRSAPLFRRFYADFYIGIGHVWQQVSYGELLNLRVDLRFLEGQRAADGGNLYNRFRNGKREFVAFYLGARFGIRFEKEERILQRQSESSYK